MISPIAFDTYPTSDSNPNTPFSNPLSSPNFLNFDYLLKAVKDPLKYDFDRDDYFDLIVQSGDYPDLIKLIVWDYQQNRLIKKIMFAMIHNRKKTVSMLLKIGVIPSRNELVTFKWICEDDKLDHYSYYEPIIKKYID